MVKLFYWKFFITSVFPLMIHFNFVREIEHASQYDDFTAAWYSKLGSDLILSSYFRCGAVFFEFFWRFGKMRLRQWYDRRFTGNVRKTRQLSLSDYKEVYSNDHFDVERSYADILNIIFFTMTYWILLPHLFFTGFINLLLIYYKDKILSKKTSNPQI